MKKDRGRTYRRKYQKTIYIWISIFFIIAQMLFSAVILFRIRSQEIQNNYEMNVQVFRQAAYNVERSNEEVRRICQSLFVNPQITKMMYTDMSGEDIYLLGEAYGDVWKPIMLGNSQIHSVYVYNGGGEMYSSYRYLTWQDESMKQLLKTGDKNVLAKPFVRTIEGLSEKEKGTKVITYVIYDMSDNQGEISGAVVVNIDWERFKEGVEQLLTFEEQENSKVFIIDQDDGVIDRTGNKEDQQFEKEIMEMLDNTDFTKDESSIFQTRRVLGERYGMFFIDIPSMDWQIVKVQDYAEIFSNVNRQITAIVIISVVFCVLMVVSTYFLAKKIYSPIGQLVKKVKGTRPEDNLEVDEIQYLDSIYEDLSEKYEEYKKKYSRNSVLLSYNLQNLLSGGKETEAATWEALEEVEPEFFQNDHYFGVSILQIDGYRKLENMFDDDSLELCKFVVENIFSEILGNSEYKNIMIPIEKNRAVMLIQGKSVDEEEYRRDIEKCLRITNENLKRYIPLNCSMVIGPYRKGRETISLSYVQTEDSLSFLHAYGNETVLFYDHNVKQAEQKETDEVMRTMEAHVKEGAKEKIKEDFLHIKDLVRRQESSRVTEFIISQTVYILHLIAEKGKANNMFSGSASLEQYSEILEMDNWDDMSEQLQNLLMAALTPGNKQTQKTSLLVSTIQKIIQEEYTDPNLCLQKIAEMVKMSTQYVGRIFKGSVGISVAEYINEYRLEKSIEIMKRTKCTVNEVVEKVGIENESQYYRMFKKKYGNTPKAYMIELMLENHREE